MTYQVRARVSSLRFELKRPGVALAVLWQDGKVMPLNLPADAVSTTATTLNDLGVVIGTSYDDSSGEGVADPIATLWRRGRALDINTLVAAGDPLKPFVQLQWGLLINNAGQLVVLGHDGARCRSDADGLLFPYEAIATRPEA